MNTPGAEDNAPGCARVLELAHPPVPANPGRGSLFLCCADGEAQQLQGSVVHVQSLVAANDPPKVQAVVIMDMIGCAADANLPVMDESGPQFLDCRQPLGAAG